MSLLVYRGGAPLDHIGIGVPDTESGVNAVARRLGYKPILQDPVPGQFYWSGTLPLGAGRFLEILGPNPIYKGFNPFIEIVKKLEQPTPLFWYIATHDFTAFTAAAKEAGARIQQVESAAHTTDGVPVDYTRAMIGPGFLSVCPNVIQWRSRYEGLHDDAGPSFLGLTLTHPEASRLNRLFKSLGIEQHVKEGPHQIAIKLGTPKGEVEFSGAGLELRGPSAMIRMANLYVRWLMRGRTSARLHNWLERL
ncbi:VOC family protein [Parasphingorhabdus sp.]|uniref:VOC family protein n=1 Tax=Parasphingorhabdus sp. TaxID=2709688 RepID=UPI003265B3D2